MTMNTGTHQNFRESLTLLADAQKTAGRGAPAYSRFINRRVGRYLAAWAVTLGLGPNAVTGISAVFTASAIIALIVAPTSVPLGIVVAVLLVGGYAFDSADGQVARLTGTGSAAGEWLDHMVDAVKIVALPLALTVNWFQNESVPHLWLAVPLVNAVAGSALFFGMILTEQLRRAVGVVSRATPGAAGLTRSLFSLPTDYGVLCWSFALLGLCEFFQPLYLALTLALVGYLVLAAIKWFREIKNFG